MPPRLRAFLHPFYHYGIYVLAVAVIVVCVVALVFKFWLMPNIERFKTDVEVATSQALGKPVTVGRLEAGWDAFNPRLTLRDVRLADGQTVPLALPRVDAVFSWWSLLLLEPHLARLTLERPYLSMSRDQGGVIHVAGIAVNVPGAPSPFPDWLLRQPQIIVRDATVSWQDEKLLAPEMRLHQVRIYVRNRFGRHRFAGVALPSDAAGRVEVRGDLRGASLRRWENWSGQIYSRVDDARFDTWGRWVPWAQEAVRQGRGAMRFWLDLERGQVRALTGDTRLYAVAVNVSDVEPLPDLAFHSLVGRVGWAREFERQGQVRSQTFFVENLRFAVAGETPSEPASVRVQLIPDGRGGLRTITASASNLRLEALTALTGALPLPRRGHDLVAVLNPRGLVESASGHWSGSADYGFKLRVRDVGGNAYAALPGFSGLSARIEADQDSGQAELRGRDLLLSMDKVFRHPLEFKELEAMATWKIDGQAMRLSIEKAIFDNTDLAGSAEGTIELPKGAAPRLDLRAHLSHGEASAVYRYLPRAVGEDTYDWLRHALVGGHSDDARLVLKGDLAHFPFDKGGGEFKVTVNVVDAVLDYANDWPRIEGVNGTLVFQDKIMALDAVSGRILNTRLGPVRARIPDLHASGETLLLIDGRAAGRSQGFLEFIRQSPVNGHTGGFTERMRAEGEGELALNLKLPLRRIASSQVGGVFTLHDNLIHLGDEFSALERVSGRFSFTDSSIQARNVQARLFGHPAVLAFASQTGGVVHARLNGQMSSEQLRSYLPVKLAQRISGASTWQADVHLGKPATEIELTSDLLGLAIDLPAPFRKTADQAIPLAITRQPGEADANVIKAHYGNLLAIYGVLPARGAARIAVRVAQGDAPLPTAAGIAVSGKLRTLDLDAWRALEWSSAGVAGPGIHEIKLSLNECKVAGRLLHDMHVQARPSGGGWQLAVAGRELDGSILTVPTARGSRVIANFKRLKIPEAGQSNGGAGVAEPELAEIELNARRFDWGARELGELRLRLSPQKHGYSLDHVALQLPEGRFEGGGLLSRHPRRPTRLDLSLTSSDVGKLLDRLGFPGSIRGASAHIRGQLNWNGGIGDFAVDKLGGDFSVALKKGQFLKVEPGAAKLIGILSLQALPRRIALDFRDVFSDGFAFDEIQGSVHLAQGAAYTKDLRMNGPAAKVSMSGVVDLLREAQNLRVSIQPRLDDTVAVAGAIVGGPVVGIGTLIASKVLKNPFGQALTFDYRVSGGWSEPVINKIKRPVQEATLP